MPLLTRATLRARAPLVSLTKSASTILAEEARDFRSWVTYDVFLSHSYADAEAIRGLKATLEKYDLKVYVDWEVDPQLDRSKVTRESAEQLRKRMKSCRSLFFAMSPSASTSRWMPWELGFFDGFKGKVALVPITETETSSFVGQEYLSLYPYVDETGGTLWVNKPEGGYLRLTDWLQ